MSRSGRSHAGRPPRLLGLRPRYVKLMRRMQIKSMTFKERRKLFMFNGKRNKQGKFTGHWK